jgi:hypothetical protein
MLSSNFRRHLRGIKTNERHDDINSCIHAQIELACHNGIEIKRMIIISLCVFKTKIMITDNNDNNEDDDNNDKNDNNDTVPCIVPAMPSPTPTLNSLCFIFLYFLIFLS